jgi:Protein of unknown function (DUF1353)
MNRRRGRVLMEQIMSDREFGHYTGRLVLESLSSGRQTKTTSDFGFLDNDGRHWPVPPGTIVDGASIPNALWFLFGDRWEGKYREAIAVHDYYCAVRTTDWRSVRRVFYHAMLASGISVRRAKLVYAGVYFAGPRWRGAAIGSLQTSQPAAPPQTSHANTLYALCRDPVALAVSEAIKCNGRSAFDWITSEQHPDKRNSQILLGLDGLSDMVEEDDPPLQELEAAIDYAVSLIPCLEDTPRSVSLGRTELLN